MFYEQAIYGVPCNRYLPISTIVGIIWTYSTTIKKKKLRLTE